MLNGVVFSALSEVQSRQVLLPEDAAYSNFKSQARPVGLAGPCSAILTRVVFLTPRALAQTLQYRSTSRSRGPLAMSYSNFKSQARPSALAGPCSAMLNGVVFFALSEGP